MQVLRLHDPGRRPSSWTEIIQPRQFAAFAKNLDTGAASDADGRGFPVPADNTAGDADPSALRRRRLIAWTLIVLAIPTLVLAYRFRDGGHQIFAGFVGLNLLVAAGRLLWFNLALRETEEVRRKRMAAAAADGTDRP